MLNRVVLAGLVALAPLPALAADMTAPVRDVMKVAQALWSNAGVEGLDYFDAQHIGDFSAAFQATYKEATKHPAFDSDDGTGSPFDYDPITDSQDGCPLQDLEIKEGAMKDGVTDVAVNFKLMACYDGSEETLRDAVTTVHFDVVVEDGKAVIADVKHDRDGASSSLLKEMQDINSGG